MAWKYLIAADSLARLLNRIRNSLDAQPRFDGQR